MDNLKIYYGKAFINSEDINNAELENKIELEYYKTKNDRKYGIEIIKKEYKKNKTEIEKSNINDINESSRKVINIIETLKKYKVTPIRTTRCSRRFIKTK